MPYGAQIKYGIGRQASAGTAVTVATSFHPFPLLNEDIGLEKEELISENLTGRFAQGAVYDGVSRVTGTKDFELTPRNLGAALAAAINHSPTVITSGSVKGYTFLPNTTDFGSTLVKSPWTVYKQFTDSNSAEHFYDVQFGQIEFLFAQGQFVRGRMTAAGGTRTATGIGSMDIVPPATDIGRLFPWNVNSISFGGSGVSNFSEIGVVVNENIAPLYALDGTLAPNKFTREGFREVTVNGTFYFTNRDLLNDFVTGTQRRLLVFCANTRVVIQSGYHDSLLIDVPQLKITQFKPGASGPGEVSVSFTGRGVTDATSDYQVQFTLQNTYAAGY